MYKNFISLSFKFQREKQYISTHTGKEEKIYICKFSKERERIFSTAIKLNFYLFEKKYFLSFPLNTILFYLQKANFGFSKNFIL